MTDAGLNPDGRPLRKLSDRQKEAIEWLAAGYPTERVALLVHQLPALVAKWLRSDLMFRDALAARRSNPRPPSVDLLESALRRFDPGELEQPWAEENKEE
jgi:hypothetical protein